MIVGLNDRSTGENVVIGDLFAVHVDCVDVGKDETRALHLRADRCHDVADLDLARRDFGKHRRKERVVIAAEQHDLCFRRAQSPLEPAGDRNPGKTAADDHDDRHAMRLKNRA